jgi:hypothetical protein
MSFRIPLLLALLLAMANCGIATPRSMHARHRDNHQHIAAMRLREARLPGPEKLLPHAAKFDIQGRNWPQLVHKLHQQPNSTITIVTLGGSVTVGYTKSNTSYPEEFMAWLQQLYPAATFQLHNLARRATAATFAALCVVQDVPQDADLIVVEYSVNGYGGQCQCFTSPQVAGYETLLRKLITKAPQAALLGFASFMWKTQDQKRAPYYETGEDQQAVVARRYGVPFMSVRDALYDAMWDPSNPHGVKMSEILVDIVHPGDHGAKVYASFLAWALRHQAMRLMLPGVAATEQGHHRHSITGQQRLPPPIKPEAAQEHWTTFCADGLKLKEHVVANKGWNWVDEGSNTCGGCHKYGYATWDVGASITFAVNSALLSEADKKSNGTVKLAVSYLRSYSDMGVVRLECVSGCKCSPLDMDAKNVKPTSELHTQRTTISDHPRCLLKLTVLDKTSTGKHKFRVSSLAVHKQDKILSSSYAPVYDHH